MYVPHHVHLSYVINEKETALAGQFYTSSGGYGTQTILIQIDTFVFYC